MGARNKGDARWYYTVWAAATALSLPFAFAFGYMAGGAIWGLYTMVMTACFMTVGALLYARR